MCKKATEAVKNFLNAFDVDDQDRLYCISSRVLVDQETEDDILGAEKAREDAKNHLSLKG